MGEKLPIETRMAQAERRWPGIVLKRKNHKEAAGPCPWCGGDDRFRVWGAGNYACRPGPGHCGREGWIDENDRRQLTDAERLEMRIAALEQKQRETDARLSALEKMHECTDHLRYHAAVEGEARGRWYCEGIFDEAIDRFLLGYARRCPTYRASPSLTIPVFGYDGELVNIRHRLIDTEGAGGKYRPHMAGLGSQLFNPQALKGNERVLVLEGEKKTIVLDQWGFPGVGLMGKSFDVEMFKTTWRQWFDPRQEIVIALDPDALASAWKLGRLFKRSGFGRVRVADFPVKPDDAFTLYHAKQHHVEAILRDARPVYA